MVRLMVAAGFVLGVLAGCESEPAKPSGFVEKPEMMKSYDLLPVQKAWVDPNLKNADYDEVLIRPVFTKGQLANSGMEDANVRTWLEQENNDIKDFAKYTENAFRKAVRGSKKFKLVDKAGPKTLVLELALVKVVPGKPGVGAAKNLAAPVVGSFRAMAFVMAPVRAGAGAASDSPMQASVAIEGRLRDGLTNKVVATFADREKQTSAVFNLKDFRAYGNLEQIVDEWAAQFVEVLEKRPLKTGVKVEKRARGLKLFNF